MIKVFWDENKLDVFKDGKVKNVNGSFMFIPYMIGLNDPIYKSYIE